MSLRELFLLDPEVAYLNHGAFGACPAPVFAVYQELQRELEREPVEFLQGRLGERLDAVRAELAAAVGARAEDLVLVPNATTGLNAVARSLRLGPGDEILTTGHEYGALERTWRHVCARSGARVVARPLPLPLESPEAAVEAIWAGAGERTRVLFASHVTSPTALTLPVAELCARAREAGILAIVDGAHVPGHLPLDLGALGADVYAGNCHKWLCAPKGSAFLWTRPELQEAVDPPVWSWGSDPGAGFGERFRWQGTRDPAAYLAVPAALAFQREHGWEEVGRRCHELAAEARGALLERSGLEPLSADSPAWYGQMVAVPLPACDPDELQRRLRAEHGVVAPVWSWNGRTLVRISVQGYNEPSDLERLTEGLEALLFRRAARGRRMVRTAVSDELEEEG